MADEDNDSGTTEQGQDVTQTDTQDTKPVTDESLVEGLGNVLSKHEEGAQGSEQPAGVTGSTGPTGAAGATAKEPTEEEKAAAKVKSDQDAELGRLGVRKNSAAANRFRELHAEAAKAKDLEKEVTRLKGREDLAVQAERINQIFAETRASKDQIGQTLWYLTATNSGNPEQMNKAFDLMLSEVKRLGKELGRSVDAFDPITEHADLNAEIEAGSLTPERAREIARTRSAARLSETQKQTQHQQQTEQQAHQEIVANGKQAVVALGERLRAKDPHFDAKLKILTDKNILAGINARVHPSQWADAVQEAYDLIPDPVAATPAPGPMPIRPTGVGAGAHMATKPKDADEAFELAVRKGSVRMG